MARKRRSYTEEYKREAAQLVLSTGRAIADVGRELDIPEQTLGRWVFDAREEAGEDPRAPRQVITKTQLPPDPVAFTAFPGPSLLEEVRAAITKMTTEDKDKGLIALAERYAHMIEEVAKSGGREAVSVMYLGPHLFNMLKELGGTPMQRAGVGKPTEKKKSRLELLRGGREAG
ncbi:transposase [Arthrobacter phage Maja]|uniref:Helix-turn-helix DNA binding protein n=1 Tax=Arthrobacter phage Maja TaxID=2499009 RepID=A0A3S9UMW9_9CAUD|nr:transposase [Arthrobacter phage Maja]AZS11699.1 helix-turn-helix DNA-binding protein [Arthrobacter phage Maja]